MKNFLFLKIEKTITLLQANNYYYSKGFDYQIETSLKIFNLTIFKKISYSK